MNELPTNVSEDVRRLNPDVFGKALDFINRSIVEVEKPKQKRENKHDKFIRQIVEVAHLNGWKVAYSRPARVKVNGIETYRTAWGADGKGFPDLTLVRKPSVLYWEVKIPPDKVSPEQSMWLNLLDGTVVTPGEWDWIVKVLTKKE